MKLIAFLFSVLVFGISDTENFVSWDSTLYEFGEIQHNIPATATYEMTNNSDVPLYIKNVKVGCGCTTSDFSKEPVLPGQSTVIEATFNAKKVGKFTKTTSVFTNLSDEPTVLKFHGEVVSP